MSIQVPSSWIPKCSVHVPKEFIPEAMEFEENMRRFGIVKSTLYNERMASYEAEWKRSQGSPAPWVICNEPKPFIYSKIVKRTKDGDDMSHLSTGSYDSVDYFPLHQPLSSLIDNEVDMLVSTDNPFICNPDLSSPLHFGNARTGLSCVLDDLCVSPNGGVSKTKKKRSKKLSRRPLTSPVSSKVTHIDSSVPAKKNTSKKRKAAVQLRRE